MSDAIRPISAPATYRNETPYPFCPGCGHGTILDALDRALVHLALDPRRVALVSDIGCSGLSDQYFTTNAFHGLHGRSLTYASGLKLARPELAVVVLMGDGGTGIGGAHLLAAARRNLDLTLLVFNNLSFGMTGGQHSATTPPGARTATTPGGHLERPLDLCATAAANGAAYLYRGTSFEADLPEVIAEAVETEGFALLDIWEPCTAHYAPANHLTKRALYETLERLAFPTGVLLRRELPEYGTAYRRSAPSQVAAPGSEPRPLPHLFSAPLDHRFHFVVAGAAGSRVRSSVRLAARAALLSGLRAAQRDDYPVTVKTGHSMAELVLSPHPVDYTGVERADVLVLLAPEGRLKAAAHLAAMGPEGRVFALPEVAPETGETRARVSIVDPSRAPARIARSAVSLAVVAAVLEHLGLLPAEALAEAARREPQSHAEAALAAVAAGRALGATLGATETPS